MNTLTLAAAAYAADANPRFPHLAIQDALPVAHRLFSNVRFEGGVVAKVPPQPAHLAIVHEGEEVLSPQQRDRVGGGELKVKVSREGAAAVVAQVVRQLGVALPGGAE